MLTDERRAEIEKELQGIRTAQDLVYAVASGFAHQEFKAIAALIAAYSNFVRTALEQDRDYVGEANLVKIEPDHAYYLGEKFNRTVGRFLAGNAEALRAFKIGAGLVNGQWPPPPSARPPDSPRAVASAAREGAYQYAHHMLEQLLPSIPYATIHDLANSASSMLGADVELLLRRLQRTDSFEPLYHAYVDKAGEDPKHYVIGLSLVGEGLRGELRCNEERVVYSPIAFAHRDRALVDIERFKDDAEYMMRTGFAPVPRAAPAAAEPSC